MEPKSLMSPALAGKFFTVWATREVQKALTKCFHIVLVHPWSGGLKNVSWEGYLSAFISSQRNFHIHIHNLLHIENAPLSSRPPSPLCCVKSVQSCPTLCEPVDCSSLGLLCPWGFSRQEYWSGLPFLSPRYLPDLEIKPKSLKSPALAGGLFTTSATWEDLLHL